MPINSDMAEILDLYIEESMEGLDIMESGLLNLDYGLADPETMNGIFRAAHSIKGGGATLGIAEISEFAHDVETLLDEMRQGTREVVESAVQLLLQSVDCIREMIDTLNEGDEIDTGRAQDLKVELEEMLASAGLTEESSTSGTQEASAASNWLITIKPGPNFLKGDGDVIAVFRELHEKGTLKVQTEGIRTLDFDNIDPMESYLSWQVYFQGDMDQNTLEALLSGLATTCEVDISQDVAEDKEPASGAAEEQPTDHSTEEQTQSEADQTTASAPASSAPPDQPAIDANQPKNEGSTASLPAPKKEEDKKAPKSAKKKKGARTRESGSIRVSIAKIDALINLVGELVITQSMLSRFNSDFAGHNADDLREGLIQLERNTRDLQESVMQIRMLPISFTFSRFPRLVHDTSIQLGKKVQLHLSGEGTELDKTVLEKIGDPLVHLVRNSLDHGLELPEDRLAAGKPETGTVELNAFHEGGNIIIEVCDDGAGINHEKVLTKARERGIVGPEDELSVDRINNLIFMPGFSTVEEVSDLSGRGVGMDVVRRNISDLGGHVSVKSEQGKGSTFTIRLPLTLAILDGQLVKVGEQVFIVPLISMLETTQIANFQVNSVAEDTELYRLRDEYIPIIRLYDLFRIPTGEVELIDGLLVIVEANGQRVGLLVEDLLDQQQVVIKSLETNFSQIQGISGATILGDGTVALIIDVPGLIQLFFERQQGKDATSILAA